MRVHSIGMAAGALLLIAAQDAPTPPADGASFSEAFTEQSDAAKAVQAADELNKPAEDTAEATEPSPQPGAEPAIESRHDEAAEPAAEAAADPVEPSPTPAEPPEAKPVEAVQDAQPVSEAVPEPAPEEPIAIPKLAKGDPVTHDFLVGVWAEPGKSCEAGIDFQADGKMIGPFPRWELADGELTMVGNRQKMRLTVVDKNTMQSRRSETDPARTLKRCPTAPPPQKP